LKILRRIEMIQKADVCVYVEGAYYAIKKDFPTCDDALNWVDACGLCAYCIEGDNGGEDNIRVLIDNEKVV
jgi:hypothetical protein